MPSGNRTAFDVPAYPVYDMNICPVGKMSTNLPTVMAAVDTLGASTGPYRRAPVCPRFTLNDFSSTSESNLLGYWEGGDTTTGTATKKRGAVVIRATDPSYWWASVMSDTQCYDLSGYDAIQLTVSGPAGGDLLVSLQPLQGACSDATSFTDFTAPISQFLASPLSATPQTVTVPFSALQNGDGSQLSLTKIGSFNLEAPTVLNADYTISSIGFVLQACSGSPASSSSSYSLSTTTTGATSSTTTAPTTSLASTTTTTGTTTTALTTKPIVASTTTTTTTTTYQVTTTTTTTSVLPATTGLSAVGRSFNWRPRTDLPPSNFVAPLFTDIGLGSCGWSGMAAVTFDDGPHPSYTAPILDALLARGLYTTFFIIGSNYQPQLAYLLNRMLNEGHQIASHTWTHPDLTTLTDDQIRSELDQTEAVFKPFLNGQRPKFFRPPYGSINAHINDLITREYQYEIVIWGVDTSDWTGISGSQILDNYAAQVGPKSPSTDSIITLQHDIQLQTSLVAGQIFDYVTQTKGFKMVSLMECANLPAYQN
ncbi:hypothetical protein RI367_005521 [Sorochytrium milnesiophthora]